MKKAFLLLLIAAASIPVFGQTQQSGKSLTTGPQLWEFFAGGSGSLLSYAARTDGAVFGTGLIGELLPAACGGNVLCLVNAYNPLALPGHQGAALVYTGGLTSVPPAAGTSISGTNIYGLNSYLTGVNHHMTDPDYGTDFFRATDSTMGNAVTCLGGGKFGQAFNGIGAGSAQVWASDNSKVRLNTIGGSASVLAFYPDEIDPVSGKPGVVRPSDLCGGYFPGASSFAGIDPHVIFTAANDQENTVPFSSTTGTFITPETVTNGSAHAQILAVNSSFAQFGIVTGSISGNVWTGATSGATLTAISNPPTGAGSTPYANAIYKGIICDGATSNPDESVCLLNPNPSPCLANDTNPLCWYVYWTMLFEFNYLPSMAGDPHFPAADDCLPQNFNANYTGVFAPATDTTSFTLVFGDNGQNNNTGYNGGGNASIDKGYFCPNSPDGTCQGPIYMTQYRNDPADPSNHGCRVFNTMTDQVTGDWGATGQALDQEAYDVPGTVHGTLTPGDAFVQVGTGASTQLICMEDGTNTCQPSGWTQMYTGLIWPTTAAADNHNNWQDCGNNYPVTSCSGTNYFTPSAVPTNAPFLYPDVMHDMAQAPNSKLASFSLVQTAPMHVSDNGATHAVSYNATTHLTTILWNNNTVYSPHQQFILTGLVGAHDSYMNCVDANHCPVFTAVVVPNTSNLVCPGNGPYCPSGANGTITVADTLGGGSNYSDSETQVGCGGHSQPPCPSMSPNPQDENQTSGGFGGTNFAQLGTLLVAADLMSTGHHANGDHTLFQGKFYIAIDEFFPWMPATIPHGGGNPACNVAGSPCGDPYAGPLTPAPNASGVQLVPFSIFGDQHGDMNCHGTSDQCPPALFTTNVCGNALTGGVGGFPCPTAYLALWNSEIIAVENAAVRSSPGDLEGAHCSYDSSGLPEPCVFRLVHTFNSNSAWSLTASNAEGGMSPDGKYIIWPTDDNLTLGCTDGMTTNCWSSWQATAPTASGTAIHWSTDGASNVTITMNNSFCPTGGNQYYWINSAIQTISCGTRAGTVTLSGFAESWLNNKTLNLGPNTSNNWQCDSIDAGAGVCTKFILSSVAGAPVNSSGVETGAQKATPSGCNNNTPCQAPQMFIANLQTAHQ